VIITYCKFVNFEEPKNKDFEEWDGISTRENRKVPSKIF
jgi:hypothetical protein